MIKQAIRVFIALAGGSLGLLTYYFIEDVLQPLKPIYFSLAFFNVSMIILLFLSFGLMFYYISPSIITKGQKIAGHIQNEVSKIPLPELVMSVIGFIVAIIIAFLLSNPVRDVPFIGVPLTISIYVLMGYIGFNIGRRKKDEIYRYVQNNGIIQKDGADTAFAIPKVLDTSVIIDGRILDIINTGFIEGKLIIPTFVLEELRHIADSSDDLKRVKGRRGLDILNEIKNNQNINVEIKEIKFDEDYEVDIKLLKLAEKINAYVITNDFNLNKVAQIQHVKVLNINELSNAVKPQLVAGEQLQVHIMKEGKENSQGIAYLDDGTMIVIEQGRKFIGELVTVEVTSVLQTPAGRMIFAKVI